MVLHVCMDFRGDINKRFAFVFRKISFISLYSPCIIIVLPVTKTIDEIQITQFIINTYNVLWQKDDCGLR